MTWVPRENECLHCPEVAPPGELLCEACEAMAEEDERLLWATLATENPTPKEYAHRQALVAALTGMKEEA